VCLHTSNMDQVLMHFRKEKEVWLPFE
jgi:hypothetical protein